MVVVKLHKNEKGEIVTAVCDKELLGKKIEEGEKILDLSVEFYQGEEKDEGEVGDLMRNSYLVNIVGDEAVKIAIREEIIEQKQVNYIGGTPYAQVLVDN